MTEPVYVTNMFRFSALNEEQAAHYVQVGFSSIGGSVVFGFIAVVLYRAFSRIWSFLRPHVKPLYKGLEAYFRTTTGSGPRLVPTVHVGSFNLDPATGKVVGDGTSALGTTFRIELTPELGALWANAVQRQTVELNSQCKPEMAQAGSVGAVLSKWAYQGSFYRGLDGDVVVQGQFFFTKVEGKPALVTATHVWAAIHESEDVYLGSFMGPERLPMSLLQGCDLCAIGDLTMVFYLADLPSRLHMKMLEIMKTPDCNKEAYVASNAFGEPTRYAGILQGAGAKAFMRHSISTTSGTSGAPVMGSGNKVYAVHVGARDGFNLAIDMSVAQLVERLAPPLAGLPETTCPASARVRAGSVEVDTGASVVYRKSGKIHKTRAAPDLSLIDPFWANEEGNAPMDFGAHNLGWLTDYFNSADAANRAGRSPSPRQEINVPVFQLAPAGGSTPSPTEPVNLSQAIATTSPPAILQAAVLAELSPTVSKQPTPSSGTAGSLRLTPPQGSVPLASISQPSNVTGKDSVQKSESSSKDMEILPGTNKPNSSPSTSTRKRKQVSVKKRGNTVAPQYATQQSVSQLATKVDKLAGLLEATLKRDSASPGVSRSS